MRKAIVLTAYNRPHYLRRVLDSWESVRGQDDWDFYISIDKSPEVQTIIDLARRFQKRTRATVYISALSENLGVLKHPYIVMDRLFQMYDFVLRTEDDLEVSDDILEYFNWTSGAFQGMADVKSIHAFSPDDAARPSVVRVKNEFNPWVFGTWKDDWADLKANWDLDYSTYNGTPGVESGFDWHFTSRVYPANSWYGVFPEKSRVLNIGAYGVHGTPENLPTSPTYEKRPASIGGRFDLQL